MLKSLKLFTGVLVAAAFLIAGCAQQQQQQQESEQQAMSTPQHTHAVATINPTEGNNVTGTVHLEQTSNGTHITAELSGLSEGRHGFHIHQYGDCSAPDGTSAGGHYNPEGNKHSGPTQENRHVGDMGNIVADGEGNANIDYTDSVIQLNGPNSVIGRAIVLHGGEDDLESQPSGAAGPRVGCGVIGIASSGSE